MLHRVLVALLFSVAPAALPADDLRHSLTSAAGPIIAERVLQGLAQPSAIQFLPDGRALVAQRNVGLLTLADFGTVTATNIEGMPEMLAMGDAGLHDVELHPDYAASGWIYISYSEGVEIRSTLAVDRIRIGDGRVTERERIFTADAWSEITWHCGGRIQFLDGYLFVTVGDRHHRERSQELSNHAGAIVRLNDDGSVPADNPFVDSEDARNPAKPEIWSYGHRNPQGFWADAETGELWANEHGPRGGDELNRIERGANYGWPVVSFGFEYDGGPIGMGIVTREDVHEPTWVYVPSVAPSDMVIYRGAAFPAWRGSFLIGAMAKTHLNRLALRDGAVVMEERLANSVLGRIRSLAVDAAGLVYLGTDAGEIWRLRPGAGSEQGNGG
jgi:glucose/arabinose dehydrogenase